MPDEQLNSPGERPDPDFLDRATAALRNLPVPDGPPPETLRRTLDLMSNGSPTAAALRPGPAKRRFFTMRALAKLAVAAVLAMALAGVFFKGFGRFDTSVAFADVLQRIRDVHSVKFKADSVVELPNMPPIKTTAEVIVAEPLRMRQKIDPGGMINVFDFRKGRGLTLEPKGKTAIEMELSNLPAMPASISMLDALKQMDEKSVKRLDEKVFDGRKARGFESETPAQHMTIWVDVETQLPIRMEVEQHMPGLPKTTSVMHDFEWGVAVDDSMFDLTPPEGYRSQKLTVNAAPATEKDLIEGLKTTVEMNGGKFPDEFNMSVLMTIAKRVQTTGPADPKSPPPQLAADFTRGAVTISRAVTFCMDGQGGKDFHWAGAGVEVGKAGAPVLWYQPKDSADYHVIYADFSVKSVKSTDLPEVPSKAIAAVTLGAPETPRPGPPPTKVETTPAK